MVATTRAWDDGAVSDGGRRPNERLASWFLRSGWSKGELARQVNRRARDIQAPHVSTDTSRVRRWLDGEQPRDPIPRILAELFSRHFGRVVTIDDLGLREPNEPFGDFGDFGVDLPWTADALIDVLGEFARGDLMLGRQGFVGASLSLTAGDDLLVAMQRWLAPVPVPVPAVRAGPAPVPPVHVTTGTLAHLDASVRLFRRWDMQCGGGLRRKAVVGQLQAMTDLLRDPHPAGARGRLYTLTAELALLAGWMSYDAGLQPGAQKYLVLALHAAKEARDPALGANVLGVMARQIIHYERPQDALELLRLAQYGSRDTGGARLQAMLHALECRAQAALGNAERCRRAAGLAERSLEDATEDTEPDWIRYFTPAELACEIGHAYRDLAYDDTAYVDEARARMETAVALLDGTREWVRSLALAQVGLATVHLIEGDARAAAEMTGRALDIAVRIRSERLAARLRRTVSDTAQRFGGLPEVRWLEARIARELPEPPFPQG